MKKFATMFAAAAFALAIAGTAQAQGERRGQPGQGRGGMMQGGFGGFGSVHMFLANNKALQDELKITDEQKTKLEAVAKEQMEKAREAGRGGFNRDASDEERKAAREKMEKAAAESRKAFEEVLDKDQVKRLHQINYQYMGIRAFSDKEVQSALKLTDDQKESIKSIADEYNRERMEIMRGAFQPGERPSEEDRKKMQDKTNALQKDAEEKIAAKLTDEQKKAWKDLIGEKFDVSKLTMQQRRPRDN